MIRATFLAVIDQALLSALNFGVAAALIYFGTKEDYGLYAQLVNLQSFFSPLHAALFVSAFLAIGSRKQGVEYAQYRANMVRAELVVTLLSAIVVLFATFFGMRFFAVPILWSAAMASVAALLGLWWREFARQHYFACAQYRHVLRLDAGYVVLAAVFLLLAGLTKNTSTTTVLWSLGAAAIASAMIPFWQALQTKSKINIIVDDVGSAWRFGRWDTLGSIATWGYAQSYLYLAALQGGLGLVAEISAARLFAMPLPLLWASYANVIRPSASKLFAMGNARDVRLLSIKAAGVVLAIAASYALLLPLVIPLLERSLARKGFEHVYTLALAWCIYFAVTGVSTVASSVLRSALAFKEVFVFQIISCVAALIIFPLSFQFPSPVSLIVALTVVEVISAGLFWRHLWVKTRTNSAPTTMAIAETTS